MISWSLSFSLCFYSISHKDKQHFTTLAFSQSVNSTVKTILIDVKVLQYSLTFFLTKCFGLCCTLTNMTKWTDFI